MLAAAAAAVVKVWIRTRTVKGYIKMYVSDFAIWVHTYFRSLYTLKAGTLRAFEHINEMKEWNFYVPFFEFDLIGCFIDNCNFCWFFSLLFHTSMHIRIGLCLIAKKDIWSTFYWFRMFLVRLPNAPPHTHTYTHTYIQTRIPYKKKWRKKYVQKTWTYPMSTTHSTDKWRPRAKQSNF